MNGPPVELTERGCAIELIQTLYLVAGRKTRLHNGDPIHQLRHDAYIDYYQQQWSLIAAQSNGQYVALKTGIEVNNLVLQLNANRTREEIISSLRASVGTGIPDEAYENTINLAARLLLMLKVGIVRGEVLPCRFLDWKDGTVERLVKDHFGRPPQLSLQHSRVRLPRAFNAWALEKIGGINISFTDNLADHLFLVEDTKVLVFHHASYLEMQSGSIHPVGLVEETLRTLALLFPQSEFSTKRRHTRKKRKWFRSLSQRHSPCSVDARLVLCGNLQAEDRQIERFFFWRDRLTILKEAYDEATPGSLSQWWYDRRNGVVWYTFWVAILVLIIGTTFGLVQTILTGMQVK